MNDAHAHHGPDTIKPYLVVFGALSVFTLVSFVVNYFVRLRVTTHVTTATVEQLPIPTAEAAPAAFKEISGLGRLLSRRFDPVAFATLNARVANLLSRSEDQSQPPPTFRGPPRGFDLNIAPREWYHPPKAGE